ncbi:MAG: tetratricopeptide repeat protein [Planctomycetales bacterium]
MIRFHRNIGLGAATVVCLVLSSASGAETITRRGDKPVSGDVTGSSRLEVTIKVKNPKEETVAIPANQIQNIAWTGESPEANLARSDEAAGRYQKALDGYAKALQASKSTNPLAKLDLEYNSLRTTARMALADSSRAGEAIKRLEEFRKAQSDHYRSFESQSLLGQLYLSQKDFVKAQLAFDALAKAPWRDTQLEAKIFTGRLLQASNKFDEAAAAYEAIITEQAANPQEEALRQEALLGKSRVLLAQKNFVEAQKLLELVVENVDSDDSRIQAEAYVRLGDSLREQGKDKDALLAYLHVDVLFPSEKMLQAEALFHLTRLWDRIGQKGRAADARDKLEGEEFRNTEWARQLKAPAAGG